MRHYTVLKLQPFGNRPTWSVFETRKDGAIKAAGGAGPFYRAGAAKKWTRAKSVRRERS